MAGLDEIGATVGATVYQRVKADVIRGALAPGAKLKLDALKDRYVASASTLREVLSRLASEGFVEAPLQRGFRVAAVSARDLTEVAEMRILLESHALRRSIQAGDDDWEAAVVAAHHKLARMEARRASGETADVDGWKRCDWEFHLALIRACDQATLLDLHRTLYDKYLRYQMLVLTDRGSEAAEEHRAMFEAALARDADAAAAHLDRHVRRGLDHTLAAMGEGA